MSIKYATYCVCEGWYNNDDHIIDIVGVFNDNDILFKIKYGHLRKRVKGILVNIKDKVFDKYEPIDNFYSGEFIDDNNNSFCIFKLSVKDIVKYYDDS